jgi:hypothetical protein
VPVKGTHQKRMSDFNSKSGPWHGWSIQEEVRISERMKLTIRNNTIEGEGSDMDGEFELVGNYDPKAERVTLTRRYHRTTEPSQSGVGIPYDYDGTWDGNFISGRWHPRANPYYGGEFEMWPATDQTLEELSLDAIIKEPLALPIGPNS